MKKKIMAIVLGAVIAISVPRVMVTEAKADEDYALAENYSDAVELDNDTTMTLSMGRGETSWYKYIMPEGGGHVHFNLNSTDGSTKWYLEVYYADGNQLTQIEKINSKENMTTREYAYSAYSTIYLKVTRPYGSKDIKDCDITTDYTESNEINGLWETEDYNNTIDMADVLDYNNPIHGSIVYNKDIDYYQYIRTDGKRGKVSFTLTNLSSATNVSWYFSIYDGTGKLLKKVTTKTYDLATTTDEYELEPYDSIYVCVSKYITDSSIGKEYELNANFTETEENITPNAAPSVSIKSTGKNNIKFKYTRPANTSKFEVNYRKKGTTSWKKKTTTKTSVNLKGIKRKTVYQIRVRSIRSVDGVDYPGNWSSVKTAKTK